MTSIGAPVTRSRFALAVETTPGTAVTFGAAAFLTCEGPTSHTRVADPEDHGGLRDGTQQGSFSRDIITPGPEYGRFSIRYKHRQPSAIDTGPPGAQLLALKNAALLGTVSAATFYSFVPDSSAAVHAVNYLTAARFLDGSLQQLTGCLTERISFAFPAGRVVTVSQELCGLMSSTHADMYADGDPHDLNTAHTQVTATPTPSAADPFKMLAPVVITPTVNPTTGAVSGGTSISCPLVTVDIMNTVEKPVNTGATTTLGYDVFTYSDREIGISLNFKRPLMATIDPLARWLNNNNALAGETIAWQTGTTRKMTVSATVAQVSSPQETTIGNLTYWTYQLRVINDSLLFLYV